MSALAEMSTGIKASSSTSHGHNLRCLEEADFLGVEKILRIPALPHPRDAFTHGLKRRLGAMNHDGRVNVRANEPSRRERRIAGIFRAESGTSPLVTLECGCGPVFAPQRIRAQGNCPAVVSAAATLNSGLGVARTLRRACPVGRWGGSSVGRATAF